ncbi:CopG family transcriptional regulator, partial [Candidatus Roizmanbacteria bacterium]|nr:CopG family transcriptional regulator [Candidatus Roizmanbacteria bacterium]
MMQPVVVRLPDEERRLLKIEAQTQGVPVSEVARKAIKNYLKKKPRQLSGAEVLIK